MNKEGLAYSVGLVSWLSSKAGRRQANGVRDKRLRDTSSRTQIDRPLNAAKKPFGVLGCCP
mgnify:CR=1 FL=1